MKAHTKDTQATMTPEKSLQHLKEGNIRFQKNLKANRNLLEQVNDTSDGQFPFATVLSCIDSRVSAELVFDQEEYGLIKEPLIEGVPEILYELCERHNVSSEKFELYFSDEPFEGFQLVADKLREYGGGFWYQIGAKEG